MLRKEPPYRAKESGVEHYRSLARHHADSLRIVDALAASLTRLADEQQAERTLRRRRSLALLIVVGVTALGTLTLLVLNQIDRVIAVREAAAAAAQQHADMLTALDKTDALVSAMNRQVSAANEQLNEMRIEQRPWLYTLAVSVDKPSSLADGVYSIPLLFSLKNIGRVPAFDVRVSAQAFSVAVNDDTPDNRQHITCAAEPPTTGTTLFPDIPADIETVAAINKQDFAQITQNNAPIAPWIVGCIFYKYAPDEPYFHHKGFIYNVYITGNASNDKWLHLDEASIKPERFKLGVSIKGYPDD